MPRQPIFLVEHPVLDVDVVLQDGDIDLIEAGIGPQPSERPTVVSQHWPLEYRPAAPAEENSSLTTAGSRAL
jgi:hypothetical protein